MTEPRRQPAGTPVGGQFATTERTEGSVALAPPAVGALGLVPGDSTMLSGYEAGTDILDTVEIIRDDEGGYRADGAVGLNVMDGYRWLANYPDHEPLERGTDEHDTAVAWLNDHAPILETYLTERYGAAFEHGADDWEDQRLIFSVPLDPATDTTDTVAAKLENETKAVQLYNESDAGTFGSPYLWSEVKLHLAAWDNEVQHAQRGYLADVMEDAGMQYGQAIDRAEVLPAEQLAERADNVRRFMREQYPLLAQARRAYVEMHGRPFDPFHFGRDISLALHNPPNTPHGRMAFGALGPELQARLKETVARYAG